MVSDESFSGIIQRTYMGKSRRGGILLCSSCRACENNDETQLEINGGIYESTEI